MHHQRTGPRAEYRQQSELRIKASASLAEKFKQLKSLTVDLAFYNPEGVTRTSQIKYSVNIENAKSAFSFSCPNNECVRGDFDLSEHLAKAIAARKKSVSGEMCCEGWRSKTSIDTVRCANILRYKLTLGY